MSRYCQIDGTHFEQIFTISHIERRLDQVWKFICEVEQLCAHFNSK